MKNTYRTKNILRCYTFCCKKNLKIYFQAYACFCKETLQTEHSLYTAVAILQMDVLTTGPRMNMSITVRLYKYFLYRYLIGPGLLLPLKSNNIGTCTEKKSYCDDRQRNIFLNKCKISTFKPILNA